MFGDKLPFVIKFPSYGEEDEIEREMVVKIITALRKVQDEEKLNKLVMALSARYSAKILEWLADVINGVSLPATPLGKLNRRLEKPLIPPFYAILNWDVGRLDGFVFAEPLSKPIIFANFIGKTECLTTKALSRTGKLPVKFDIEQGQYVVVVKDRIAEEWAILCGGLIHDRKFDLDTTMNFVEEMDYPLVEGGMFVSQEYAEGWLEQHRLEKEMVRCLR
ncbi:MAG: hypothetical protein D6698_12285 [Gammaproteobacteria bacterium]|nr:MAG: hypothetical protein D6698_12285 [Gammaproteobacteria bacterium]